MKNHYSEKAKTDSLSWDKRPICGQSFSARHTLTTANITQVECEKCLAILKARANLGGN